MVVLESHGLHDVGKMKTYVGGWQAEDPEQQHLRLRGGQVADNLLFLRTGHRDQWV